ncbi:MAG TPA: hypothetical protein VFQ39_19420 [Longimicrobium sp.]|nr:hypothetical protein [Longimicrobium sp.]
MATPDQRERADARFEQALKEQGARDPRDFYRKQLVELKSGNADAYRRALAHFEDTLIPTVAEEGSDPVGEWLEYGRLLATLATRGRTIVVDPTGRARDYARPVPADALVLHLPELTTRPAIIVGLPTELTQPQRATYDLLVRRAESL